MSIDNATPEEWNDAVFLARMAEINAMSELRPLDVDGLNRALGRPFGELPYVTRAYVFLLHQMGKIRVNHTDGREVKVPAWQAGSRYQIEAIEKPKTKPSIDWTQIKPEYRWLARGARGCAYVHARNPKMGLSAWNADGPCARVDILVSYTPGDCGWKDSLVERPAGT